MSEKENKYRERYVRWQDNTRKQLSFFNNLLLTLSVGFLSFAYKNISDMKIEFSLSDPDLSTTLLVLSIVSILMSIFVGLLCVINRLYDFRITTHINRIRYWVEKSKNNTDKSRLDGKTPQKYCWLKRFFLTIKVLFEKYPKITLKDCDRFYSKMTEPEKVVFNNNFKKLREIAHNLGIETWTKLKWQIGLFFVGILLFVVAQLCNN
jgi:hypothetical protein